MPDTPAQRVLSRLVAVGGTMVAVGLVTAAVIIGLYLAGADLPGLWAYGLAMLAPLGFGLMLVGLLGVALARRRSAVRADRAPGR